jgi:hypothetical protein
LTNFTIFLRNLLLWQQVVYKNSKYVCNHYIYFVVTLRNFFLIKMKVKFIKISSEVSNQISILTSDLLLLWRRAGFYFSLIDSEPIMILIYNGPYYQWKENVVLFSVVWGRGRTVLVRLKSSGHGWGWITSDGWGWIGRDEFERFKTKKFWSDPCWTPTDRTLTDQDGWSKGQSGWAEGVATGPALFT